MHQFIKSETLTSGWYQCMDDTTSRCRMFKNQLESLLDKFEVCSKVTKSIRELTLFFRTPLVLLQTHLRQEVTVWQSIL